TIALGILVFMFNWTWSKRKGAPSGLDPWDARTIEWTIPNPTPHYNFADNPHVTSLDHFWHMKYDEDDEGRAVRKDNADEIVAQLDYDGKNPKAPIHLPNPSYFPILMAAGLPLIAYGIIYHQGLAGKLLIAIGAVITIGSLLGWGMEPLEEPHDGGGDHAEEMAEAH
ncbi:MAG: cytochrome ubiquinol oxidase subunit I, partial [Acidimicrobiia bacterium]